MSRKNLKNLQEEIDDLEGRLHTITHDLRSPLTVILGHAELLQLVILEAGLGALARASIDAILTAGQQMDSMMDDLTDLTRLSGGQTDLQPRLIELGQFIPDFLARSQVVMGISRVQADIPPELPPALADPACLERVLGNIVCNALKYSGDEDDVLIRAEWSENELVISVSDVGLGIHPEDLPHIFNRFFRARNVGRKAGFGLGLFITRSLIESLGGRIWAESVQGEGSTFYLTVPIGKS